MNKRLEETAREVRKEIIQMAYNAQSAHSGGALSAVEILVSLYFDVMKVYPKSPQNDNRDRLVFSKAHDAKVLYAVLALKGFFPKRLLKTYELDNTKLLGHSSRGYVPGVEVSAGGLGHGLPMAAGMAYAAKQDGKKHRIFAVISDGECDEGSTWEAILFAGHHKLDNLSVIVDYNKLQAFGYTKDVLDLEPFEDKWKAFNWSVKSVNGNSFKELLPVLHGLPFVKNKPSVIIAHTIKGLGGVPKHENQVSSQYKPPTQEEAEEAIKALNKK